MTEMDFRPAEQNRKQPREPRQTHASVSPCKEDLLQQLDIEQSTQTPRVQQQGVPVKTRTEVLRLHKPEGGGKSQN